MNPGKADTVMLLVRQKSLKLMGQLYTVNKDPALHKAEGEDQSPKLSFDLLTHVRTLRHMCTFFF